MTGSSNEPTVGFSSRSTTRPLLVRFGGTDISAGEIERVGRIVLRRFGRYRRATSYVPQRSQIRNIIYVAGMLGERGFRSYAFVPRGGQGHFPMRNSSVFDISIEASTTASRWWTVIHDIIRKLLSWEGSAEDNNCVVAKMARCE